MSIILNWKLLRRRQLQVLEVLGTELGGGDVRGV